MVNTRKFWMGFCLIIAVYWTTTDGAVTITRPTTTRPRPTTTPRPTTHNKDNDKPIIGVLAQELSSTLLNIYPHYMSYIAASYVKYLEGAGARVIPIWIKREKSYYQNIVKYINGVLFPGGAVRFNVTDGYAEAGAHLYKYALELNRQGRHFPIWGTCLGFELLAYLAAERRETLTKCYAEDVALPLHFKPDYFDSQLFKNTPANIVNILSSQNVTANYHKFCVTEQSLATLGLNQDWHVLTTNVDSNGIEFVSSMESRRVPFFGVQFHPEKNGYEFKSTKNIPHSSAAVRVMQYFANFFVDQARKSSNQFPNKTAERAALIYNYQPTYTENHLSFEQCYFFD